MAVAQRAAQEAKVAHANAQEEVRIVTAEVASTSQGGEPAPASTMDALSGLLAAVRSAGTGGGEQDQQLLAAADAAEQILGAREGSPPPAPAPAGQGQKREAEASQATELGTQELSPEDADALMKEMDEATTPEAKKTRLMAA